MSSASKKSDLSAIIDAGGGQLPVEPGSVPHEINFTTVTTPGVPQVLISYVIPAGKTFRLQKVTVRCRINSSYSLLENASLIASGILGAANPETEYQWETVHDVTTGNTVTLSFTQIDCNPVDVYAHLKGYLY